MTSWVHLFLLYEYFPSLMILCIKLPWFYILFLFMSLTFSLYLSFCLPHSFAFLYLSFCVFDLLQILLLPSLWELFHLLPIIFQMDRFHIQWGLFFSFTLFFLHAPSQPYTCKFFHVLSSFSPLCNCTQFLIKQWEPITFLSCPVAHL